MKGSPMGSKETGTDGERTVALRIVVTPMPPRACGAIEEVELALQDGAGDQPGAGRGDGAMVFETRVRVRRNAATGRPNFLGSNVNGTPDTRFLYLCWEGIEDGQPNRFGRMKIHLSPITWEQIDRVANGRGILEATVSGVSDRGRPACASVPLLGGGWHVVET
jgi:hypothetical protein